MEKAHTNAPANQKCTHNSAVENTSRIDGCVIVQRICTGCRKVIGTSITETASSAHEDEHYPPYWDCSPDLQYATGPETFRKLFWSIAAVAILCLAAALEVI